MTPATVIPSSVIEPSGRASLSSGSLSPGRGFDPTWRTRSVNTTTGPVNILVSSDARPVQWSPGQRFHHLFDQRCAALGRRASDHLAIDFGDAGYSYRALADYSNRLARYLRRRGVRRGDRVGLLFDRSMISPATVLALSKLGAAYVPLDASFPDDRIGYILDDSDVSLVITVSQFSDRFDGSAIDVMTIDEHYDAIAEVPAHSFDAHGGVEDELCYIIYTSGSTGRPKGVPIRHSSICNFLSIASDVYGYKVSDRVYQGMTIAFDFSVEELWVPLAAGATVVPAPNGVQLVGDDLSQFLIEQSITALCCVPTLLSTVEFDLPNLRLLLVSGEACPADVIAPWLTPARRVLNAYGPTETTVTATWSLLDPRREITIGGPLPTYSAVIVDPDVDRSVDIGVAGEICIGGVALSDGYINRPDQTAKAFVDDFIGLPNNPGGLLYRTGDLGRITHDNEIEYLGRIDTQVKIKGYRIELDEIASVARNVDDVGQAVVTAWTPEPNKGRSVTELVVYVTAARPGDTIDMAALNAALRDRLPAYMVPAYYEQLADIPLLPSTKVDRAALPNPVSTRFRGSAGAHVGARTGVEQQLANLLMSVLGLDEVSVDANFFEHLGADSLALAAYATAIRSELGIKRVSMKRLYENPSIEELAGFVEAMGAAPSQGPEPASPLSQTTTGSVSPPVPAVAPIERAETLFAEPPHVPSTLAYVGTGVAQLAAFLVAAFGVSVANVAAYRWITNAGGIFDVYMRSVASASLLFFGTSLALIATKWIAVGRFSTDPIPLWSTRYVWFWIAKMAIRISPLNVLIGTPAYNAYLRMLGMTVGADAVILSAPPTCVDLIEVGAGTIIRADCVFQGYTAHNGWIYCGEVNIGERAVISEATVLDINTTVGDEAQLGTTSALLSGQAVPARATYQGSPAQPSQSDFDQLPVLPLDRGRRIRYTATQLTSICFFSLPASFLGAYAIARSGALTARAVPSGPIPAGLVRVVALAFGAYAATLVVALLMVVVVPRFLQLFVRSEVVHPIYGSQWRLARAIARHSNNPLLNTVFGDSSMITGYLRLVGYDLSESTQTGSNFGVDQRHHSPFLCSFARNTLVSDGLRMLNLEVSATSFELRSIEMPPDTYIGNVVHYPADSTVGADCLLATKVAVPIDGPRRTGVGLLGSPAFEIPRSVARDQRFEHYKQPGIFEERLRLKLASNVKTMLMYLARSWGLTLLSIAVTVASMAVFAAGESSVLALATAITVATAVAGPASAVLSILIERLVRRFRPLEPLYCSLYDKRFWEHERFWKLNYNALLRAFDGTPLKPMFVRMQGAQIGAKAFDDGSGLTEPTLVAIGDNAMLNFRSTIQCHSLEDGTFKSDHVEIGDSTTLGVGAFVHYGATLGTQSHLEADSFLMKGSTVPEFSRWHGNPARDATQVATSLPAPATTQESTAPNSATAKELSDDFPPTRSRHDVGAPVH